MVYRVNLHRYMILAELHNIDYDTKSKMNEIGISGNDTKKM